MAAYVNKRSFKQNDEMSLQGVSSMMVMRILFEFKCLYLRAIQDHFSGQ